MIKYFYTILLVSVISFCMSSQCPPGDVYIDESSDITYLLNTYPDCTEIDGNFIIDGLTNSNAIKRLEDMDLISITGDVIITGTSSIKNLLGLNHLKEIGGSLTISSNEDLEATTGLHVLNHIDGDLAIQNNAKLRDVGLERLMDIDGNYYVADNEILWNIDLGFLGSVVGVDFDFESIDLLTAINNPMLSYCTNSIICDFVAAWPEDASFYNNAPGCSSIQEVQMACPACPSGDVILEAQFEIDDFVAGYPFCSTIQGDLFIGTPSSTAAAYVQDLSGLSSITSIEGSLIINRTNLLESLEGLDNLVSIGEQLSITENFSLSSFSGLDMLTMIGTKLEIYGNSILSNIDALSNLTSTVANIEISDNTEITSIIGLENIDSINSLTLSNNPQLSDCAIASVCDYLELGFPSIFGNGEGCASTEEVEMSCTIELLGNLCIDAIDFNNLLGEIGIPQTSILLDNTNNTATDTPNVGFECHFDGDPVHRSLWVRFTGDGNNYRFTTTQCSASDENYISDGDTQMALYSGSCDMLIAEACSDDITVGNLSAEIYNFPTIAGREYFLLLDGFGGLAGEFCLEVTQQETVSITELSGTKLKLFPNPVSNQLTIQLEGLPIGQGQLKLFNVQGQAVAQWPFNQSGSTWSSNYDISALPASVYTVQLITSEGQLTRKILKE